MAYTKKSTIYNIVLMQCPRCQKGKMYRTPLLAFKGIYDMHTHCPECNENFEPEIGFYWGAMYIGYALSSGALLISALLCLVVFGLELWQTYTILLTEAVLCFAYNARVSRAIWLNMYGKYDQAIADKVREPK